MVKFFSALLLIAGISLIVSVLLQDSKSEGMGAIGGQSENIWGRAKSNSKEAVLARITTISAVAFMISALAIAAIQ